MQYSDEFNALQYEPVVFVVRMGKRKIQLKKKKNEHEKYSRKKEPYTTNALPVFEFQSGAPMMRSSLPSLFTSPAF